MKYIRTKNKIYKSENPMIIGGKLVIIDYDNNFRTHMMRKKVIKIGDTIEDLIMPHDLVKCGLDMYLLEKDSGECLRDENMRLVKRNEVDCLWVATGEDIEVYPNFKLVAEKNEETGKLELL